jgi:hypothetical protein
MRMIVNIHRNETSQPIKRVCVNTYTKGEMYCVQMDGYVEKYPLSSLFRVTETYHAEAEIKDEGK